MASPLFFKRLAHHLGLESLFGVHLFESRVLRLKLLHPGHQCRVHAAVLRAPFVEARAAHPVLATQLRNGCSGFGLLQDPNDLAFRESGRLHAKFPVDLLLENSTLNTR
jgi:hypothetical protein